MQETELPSGIPLSAHDVRYVSRHQIPSVFGYLSNKMGLGAKMEI